MIANVASTVRKKYKDTCSLRREKKQFGSEWVKSEAKWNRQK